MSHITISMDTNRRDRLAHRATEVGCKDIGELINQLVERELAEAEIESLGGPTHLSFRTESELEQMLLQRLNDPRPSVEVTPEFWNDIRRRAGLPLKDEGCP